MGTEILPHRNHLSSQHISFTPQAGPRTVPPQSYAHVSKKRIKRRANQGRLQRSNLHELTFEGAGYSAASFLAHCVERYIAVTDKAKEYEIR